MFSPLLLNEPVPENGRLRVPETPGSMDAPVVVVVAEAARSVRERPVARHVGVELDAVSGVAEIVRHLSQHLVLEPGDLVSTGTPQGVALSGRFPYLDEGDVMEIGIEGLGEQRQRLVAAER